jgi:transketolase
MRDKFADVIFEIGKKDKRISALVADISPAGSMVNFRKKFPKRFINCGVAEQSMIGIAAGMALQGLRPFCYTIATFALYRPFEMIRVDLCYQNLPVTIVGMGAGLIYSTLGGTHQSIEDLAVASAIPNMTVLAPCDPNEMKLATEWCATKSNGPVYMRLGKKGEPDLTSKAIDKFEVGKIRYLEKGNEIAIVSYGTIVSLAFELSRKIKELHDKKCSIISSHTIKPFDKNGFKNILNNHKKVIIIEEHVKNGSLSDKVKSFCHEQKINNEIFSFTLKDQFYHFYGSYKDLLSKHGLDVSSILKKLSI